MDIHEVRERSKLTLLGGLVFAVAGFFMVRSQLGALDPSTAVTTTGWLLSGIGVMAVQASMVGLLIAVARTSDRNTV